MGGGQVKLKPTVDNLIGGAMGGNAYDLVYVPGGENQFLGGSSEVSPSLVTNGQSRTKTPWTRKQKRTFKHLTSWMSYMRGQGCQLLRVDLTSVSHNSEQENKSRLTEQFKKLRRIIERKFHLKMHYFKIETSEGYGVLHMVWAIKSEKPVWIPQRWLSEAWKNITGAKIVYIKRVSKGKSNVKRIGRYCVEQYLAGQSAIVRVSWSWWRSAICLGKSFKEFYQECRKGFEAARMAGISPFTEDLNYGKMLGGWTKLLEQGYWYFGGAAFFLSGKSIDVGYEY